MKLLNVSPLHVALQPDHVQCMWPGFPWGFPISITALHKNRSIVKLCQLASQNSQVVFPSNPIHGVSIYTATTEN